MFIILKPAKVTVGTAKNEKLLVFLDVFTLFSANKKERREITGLLASELSESLTHIFA